MTITGTRIPTGLISILCIIFLFAGCGPGPGEKGKYTKEQMAQMAFPIRTDTPANAGVMVFNVGSETIISRDIVTFVLNRTGTGPKTADLESFRQHFKPIVSDVVLQRATDAILYQEAKKNAPEGMEQNLKKAVEAETDRFLAEYNGNYADAEKALADMGMNWQQFRQHQEKLLLSRSYVAGKLEQEKPITHGELTAYYESVKETRFKRDGLIQFRLIDIDTSKRSAAGQDSTALASQIIEQIRSGQDFAALAEKYSDDHRAAFGGLWTPVTISPSGTSSPLVKPYDAIIEQTRAGKPGQISGPIETGGHIFIVKLEQNEPAGFVPLEEVSGRLEAELKFKARTLQFEQIMSKLVKQADMTKMEGFVDFCIDEAYRQYRIKQAQNNPVSR